MADGDAGAGTNAPYVVQVNMTAIQKSLYSFCDDLFERHLRNSRHLYDMSDYLDMA